MSRDWIYELGLIAHHCPGLSEPMNLPLEIWNGIIQRLPKIIGVETHG